MSTGSRVLVVGFALAFSLAACGSDSGGAEGTPPGGQAGTAGAACYPNGTCNTGLECQAGTCVATSTPSADSDVSSTATDEGGAADPGAGVDPGGQTDPEGQADPGGEADPGGKADLGSGDDPGNQADPGGESDPGAACTNQCSTGSIECAGDGYRTCGDTNGDGCSEWSDITPCGEGKECKEGVCRDVQACTDLCTEEATECASADSTRECIQGADGCTAWSSATSCPAGKVCEAGSCVCKAEDEKRCDGDAVFWFDSCGQRGDKVEDCHYGCAGGECKPCSPACGSRDCGDNGCGGTCGTCTGGKVCSDGSCTCQANAEMRCDGDAVYAHDSCGQRGDKVADCPHGCENATCNSCTPTCGPPECGPDGCGGTCGTCSNGICMSNGTCGCTLNYDCDDDSVCISGTCTLAYGRAYTITFVSAKISEKHPQTDSAWDGLGGAPDPQLAYKFGGVEGHTSTAQDTFRPAWNHSFDVTLFESQEIAIYVWDMDLSSHDGIGGIDFSPPRNRIPLEWIRGGGVSWVPADPTYGLQELVLVVLPMGANTGACANAADVALLNSEEKFDGAVGKASSCGMTALTKPAAEQQQFAVNCVKTDTGLSEACAACFAASTVCAIQNCVAQCAADFASEGCTDCREEKGCTPDFYTCSGFRPSE